MFFHDLGDAALATTATTICFPTFLTMQQKLAEGYRRYQNATSTRQRPTYIAPVGLVFQTIYNDLIQNQVDPTNDGTLFSSLYSPDGSHPSILGSYVTALTLHSSMTGLDPTTPTTTTTTTTSAIRDDQHWRPDSIPEDTARLVQDAVKRTLLETAASGFITYPWGDVFARRSAMIIMTSMLLLRFGWKAKRWALPDFT